MASNGEEMIESNLLKDCQIQQFIRDGYIVLRADYPKSFHREVYDRIENVFEKEGNVGNNILPRIPQIGEVFDHPNIRGALTSLLGSGYTMNPHRHCHLNPPGSKGQSWHKDCYVYDHNIRHPRFHWVLAFYYPQNTTEEMGPSGIIPGTHAYKAISDPNPGNTQEPDFPVIGEPGTVAIIHFDSWHRAGPNFSDRKRYMLKFQFARMQEPDTPTWDHSSPDWETQDSNTNERVWTDVWNWIRGSVPENGRNDDPALVKELTKDLEAPGEEVRLDAAYELARFGEAAVPTLIEIMRKETLATVEETTAKTADNAHGTNPTAGVAAQGLTAIGAPAVPALAEMLSDDHWWIRSMAASVLSKIGAPTERAVGSLSDRLEDNHWWVRRNALEALAAVGVSDNNLVSKYTRAVSDPDYRVRRNAALALARTGAEAETAIPALTGLLDDENRYNRFYGVLALRRIGTPAARDAALDALFTARWCPITNPESLF